MPIKRLILDKAQLANKRDGLKYLVLLRIRTIVVILLLNRLLTLPPYVKTVVIHSLIEGEEMDITTLTNKYK